VKHLFRYWGYYAFVVLISAWLTHALGPVVLIVASVVVSAYFLFQAPVWCCAINRDHTLCRNNSAGLLLGCSKRQHKWQKLKMIFVPAGWRALNRGLWASPRECITTISSLLALVPAIVTVGRMVVGLFR
jgi:hypothetical protein